ncbi:hypothetical protein BDV33DRAFT_179517 [Aspergillus novoparasiticus]|uniref:Uncharacterized protein n=1 Tax=Aspergillus novoparasiticus TaxID=986946 RepID=A0A5N6EEX6_9EURO|nr:hypothetical protein BDV33DRAFT_179517 [Aspergillus novoparasiticus]
MLLSIVCMILPIVDTSSCHGTQYQDLPVFLLIRRSSIPNPDVLGITHVLDAFHEICIRG